MSQWNETDDKKVILEELMEKYGKDVFLLAYSFVKEKALAEDISQEVFIKCYRSIEGFRGEASIKSWIYRITVNTSKDFLKRKSFNVLKYPKWFFENLQRSGSSEEKVIERNQNEMLLDCVLKLPVKYREAIVLHYLHDLKINEIADALDINPNTVKTRLTRGRNALKKVLIERGESPSWINN
jgi:RNA polymerase sigma-70 factor, ECF subfamily